MKKICIASTNPVKMKAATQAFEQMFPGEVFESQGVSVSSGVADQPMSGEEAFLGAWNRVENASKHTEADYWVGMEGGIEDKNGEMEAFAWMIVKAANGKFGKSRTTSFFLPPKVAELVRSGIELGTADDMVFGRMNSKQQNGAIGLLTDNVLDRTKYYTDAVIAALIPFKNEQLY